MRIFFLFFHEEPFRNDSSEDFCQKESDITILHSLELPSEPSLFDFENHLVTDAEPSVDF